MQKNRSLKPSVFTSFFLVCYLSICNKDVKREGVSTEALLTRGEGRFMFLKEKAKGKNFTGALNTLVEGGF